MSYPMKCIFDTTEKKLLHNDSFNKLIKKEKLLDFKIGAMCKDLYTPLNMKYVELDKIDDTVDGVYKGVDKHDYDTYKLLDARMDDAIDKHKHTLDMLKGWFGYIPLVEQGVLQRQL